MTGWWRLFMAQIAYPTKTATGTSMEVPPTASGLDPLEAEAVDLFVGLAQVVGLPKSVGQIYGLLYISIEPLSLDAVAARLEISKGSASQGLKFLRSTGAIRLAESDDSRSDRYEAETGLRALASGFLKEQIEPHLESGEERLSRLRRLVAEAPAPQRKVLAARVDRLGTWHQRAAGMLPLLIRFLGK